MKKKYIFIIILVFVLAFVGLFVFVMNNGNDKDREYIDPFYFFEVTEYGDISFVEDEKVGLNFIIPNGWKKTYDFLAQFSIVTENFVPTDNTLNSSSLPKNGCWIGISVDHEENIEDGNSLYDSTKHFIDNPEEIINEGSSYRDIINISEIKSLRESLIIENKGKAISIYTPLDNKIYLFETYLFGEDKEFCETEFNNFLNTISIKK
ncbi:MAG: hypothetical protein WC909_03615 [Candidatus Paceibacterota bacterium]|jgi:hypothetical protein